MGMEATFKLAYILQCLSQKRWPQFTLDMHPGVITMSDTVTLLIQLS
jgi:hypothetical protein